MVAGLAGLAVFLVLHHLLIVPIWFVAPIGGLMAAAGGAAVGAAYAELLPRIPVRPWRTISVSLAIVAILTPSIALAEATGPVYALGGTDGGTLLVPASQAIAAFVVGLLGLSAVTGAALGWLIGRTPRAAGWTGLAGFALAIGPGHNIPLLGATRSVAKELFILFAVTVVSAVVLVRRAGPGLSHMREQLDLGSGGPTVTVRVPEGRQSRPAAIPAEPLAHSILRYVLSDRRATLRTTARPRHR